MTATAVKLLIETCGRCGGQVVGDNMGNGRPWQHVDRPDDHHVIFGTPAPPGIVDGIKPTGLDALEDILEDEPDVTLPPPGTPVLVPESELGLSGRSGVRQMMNAATKGGFTHEIHSCVGPVKIGTQHDPRGFRYVESLLVGFKHDDGRAAVAVWERLTEKEGATFTFAIAFAKGKGMKSTTELKAYLRSD